MRHAERIADHRNPRAGLNRLGGAKARRHQLVTIDFENGHFTQRIHRHQFGAQNLAIEKADLDLAGIANHRFLGDDETVTAYNQAAANFDFRGLVFTAAKQAQQPAAFFFGLGGRRQNGHYRRLGGLYELTHILLERRQQGLRRNVVEQKAQKGCGQNA